MRGPMIETSASRIRDAARKDAENETKMKTALNMLKRGKLTIEEIAEYSELTVEEVEKLASLQLA